MFIWQLLVWCLLTRPILVLLLEGLDG